MALASLVNIILMGWCKKYNSSALAMELHLSCINPSISDNGLSTVWNKATVWANADLLSIGPSGTNFREIFKKNTKMPYTIYIYKMAAILSQIKYVNDIYSWNSIIKCKQGNLNKNTKNAP